MSKHLLFATDLLEGSHCIGLRAKEIAEHLGAKLSIIHVIEVPITAQYAQALGFTELITPPIEEVKAVLSTFAEEMNIPAGLQYVTSGNAAHEVIEKAAMLSVDAIIIGSHAESALPNFLGTTANTIVHKAPCDVITLKAKQL